MLTTKTTRARLGLETLEKRENPAAFIQNGDIMVNLGNGNDTLTIHQQSGWYRVVENGVTTWFAASRVTGGDVIVRCNDGNDYVNNYASSLRLEAFGQHGNDTLIGDAQADHLHGGEGDDTLYGYGGNDFLEGRVGTDRLYGMTGNDTLDGGVGDGAADYLNGGSGQDYFRRDNYYIHIFGLTLTRNRDNPADFVSGVDSMYS